MKNKIIFLVFGITLFLVSCEDANTSDKSQPKKGMIKVTILYPNDTGKTFDMDYYANKHMPMLIDLFGDSLKRLEIDKGLSGRTSNDPIPYLAIGYLYFENLVDYQNSFGPNAAKIRGDIPNYTNIKPIVQISKVVQ
ncbi:conserved hypothetical protein [Aquimarina amphilecti]|uniref:EthD domain-containing protein n=1 Tax=Aquimarina amphilecti TaxID=1038014 RepID=A0A1H7MVE1_AQUAM|nr:EthD family reductase [Aquimarina amphilecti]SEL14655.1 conserved hypothetical protein [Aquimarina amphilecti]